MLTAPPSSSSRRGSAPRRPRGSGTYATQQLEPDHGEVIGWTASGAAAMRDLAVEMGTFELEMLTYSEACSVCAPFRTRGSGGGAR